MKKYYLLLGLLVLFGLVVVSVLFYRAHTTDLYFNS